MASRQRRKRRKLPEWIGEVYDPKMYKRNDEEEICVGEEKSEGKPSNSSSKQQTAKRQNSETGKKSHDKTDKETSLSAEEIIRLSLPLLKYEGSLIYSYNTSDCSFLCEDMLTSLSSEDTWHVGFDMEWPVTYKVGASGKVALIQVCTTANKCYLFHVSVMGVLPKSLIKFLSHKQIIKYGINIEADFWKLERDFDGISAREIIRESVQDLGQIANKKMKSAERWTLDGLTRNVFRKRLDKEETVRCGKWDCYPLSEEQTQYAANDAYASFLLADKLRDK